MLGGPAAFLAGMILALILCGTLPGRVFFTNWGMRLAGAMNVDEIDDGPSLPPTPDDNVFEI